MPGTPPYPNDISLLNARRQAYGVGCLSNCRQLIHSIRNTASDGVIHLGPGHQIKTFSPVSPSATHPGPEASRQAQINFIKQVSTLRDYDNAFLLELARLPPTQKFYFAVEYRLHQWVRLQDLFARYSWRTLTMWEFVGHEMSLTLNYLEPADDGTFALLSPQIINAFKNPIDPDLLGFHGQFMIGAGLNPTDHSVVAQTVIQQLAVDPRINQHVLSIDVTVNLDNLAERWRLR